MLCWGFKANPARCLSVEKGARRLLWQETKVKCRVWGKVVTRDEAVACGCLMSRRQEEMERVR